MPATGHLPVFTHVTFASRVFTEPFQRASSQLQPQADELSLMASRMHSTSQTGMSHKPLARRCANAATRRRPPSGTVLYWLENDRSHACWRPNLTARLRLWIQVHFSRVDQVAVIKRFSSHVGRSSDPLNTFFLERLTMLLLRTFMSSEITRVSRSRSSPACWLTADCQFQYTRLRLYSKLCVLAQMKLSSRESD